MKFNLTYLGNLKMFYHLCKDQSYVPLFHGTRRYAVECDPFLIKMMRRHCINILEKARDHFNSVDDETYSKYEKYKRESKLTYFASAIILTFGRISNFQYGDFYMTKRFDQNFLLRFTTYGCGEIGKLAYDNILGLQHFNIDLGITESMEFVLKHYPLFIDSEPIVLILNDYTIDELESESGNKVYDIEYNVNIRLKNYENKEFYVINQSLFDEASILFNEENREILESSLSKEEKIIGLGWLHDVFYSGKLFKYTRKIPIEEYNYTYIYTKTEFINASKVICNIFLNKKIDYEDLALIDKAIFLFENKPFAKLAIDDFPEEKSIFELSKYLSWYILDPNKSLIKIAEDVFTKGIYTSLFARTLFIDLDKY